MAIGDNMTKRDQVMVGVAIVAIALAVLYWNFVFGPKNAELDTQAQHVEDLQGKNRRAASEMAKGTVADLQRQAVLYQQNLEMMRQLVPTGNEVPALIDQVSTAARRVGLDIGSLQPQPVIPGEQFDTYRYQIVMDGGYHRLAEFLTGVGSLTRIVAPVNLKLSPTERAANARRAAPNEATLRAEFEIQTYVAKTSDDETGGRQ